MFVEPISGRKCTCKKAVHPKFSMHTYTRFFETIILTKVLSNQAEFNSRNVNSKNCYLWFRRSGDTLYVIINIVLYLGFFTSRFVSERSNSFLHLQVIKKCFISIQVSSVILFCIWNLIKAVACISLSLPVRSATGAFLKLVKDFLFIFCFSGKLRNTLHTDCSINNRAIFYDSNF